MVGAREAYVVLGEDRKCEMKAKCLLIADKVLHAGAECGVSELAANVYGSFLRFVMCSSSIFVRSLRRLWSALFLCSSSAILSLR